jgi:uncharacterized membrane-anchored protein
MMRTACARALLACALLTMQPLVLGQQPTGSESTDSQASAQEQAASDEIRKLGWQRGPASGQVGDHASVQVPGEGGLLGETDGAKFLRLTGNLPSPGTTILAYHDWWATLSFDDLGYVKDDEKLDADAILTSLRDNDANSNEQRHKLGFQELHTDGWVVPPHYDPDTHHLEWGVRLRVEGESQPTVNYTVRLLGRKGVEDVTLVTSAEHLDHDIAELRTLLAGFEFNSGERYAEFKPGDHIAEFGLGALIAGGAAAAVVKSGLWKTILVFLAASWKLVVAAAAAAVAGVNKLFRRKA